MRSVSVARIQKNRYRTTIAKRMVETRAELPFIGDQIGLFRTQPGRPRRNLQPFPVVDLPLRKKLQRADRRTRELRGA